MKANDNKIDNNNIMYQVSTLQALAMGYTKKVVTVKELMSHGDIGLGTFENLGGEMIVVDGKCFCARENGEVEEISGETGVPFSSVSYLKDYRKFNISHVESIERLREVLDLKIEEFFGLNSIHIAKITGKFKRINARSEAPYISHHISLVEILSKNQKSFEFVDISGTLVCVYYPDYMDGINAPGWHIHFVDEERKLGGHVFDLITEEGQVYLTTPDTLQIQIPRDAAFDTYSLKQASKDDIDKAEKGTGK